MVLGSKKESWIVSNATALGTHLMLCGLPPLTGLIAGDPLMLYLLKHFLVTMQLPRRIG